MKKTAIICHGGAMKSAFAAGVLYFFSKNGINLVDLIIGTSSSVPTTCYFASQQFNLIKDIWENELGKKDFINFFKFFKGEPIFNSNKIVDNIFKNKKILDFKKIIESPSRLLIPLYNYKNHTLNYWSNKDSKIIGDFWDVLKASMVVHDKFLIHKNGLEKYVDADLSPFSIYENNNFLKEIDNFIIISNHKDLEWNIKKEIGLNVFSFFQSKNFPDGVKWKLKQRKKTIINGIEHLKKFINTNNKNILFIKPKKDFSLKICASKNKNIKEIFESGFLTGKKLFKDKRDFFDLFIERSKTLRR